MDAGDHKLGADFNPISTSFGSGLGGRGLEAQGFGPCFVTGDRISATDRNRI